MSCCSLLEIELCDKGGSRRMRWHRCCCHFDSRCVHNPDTNTDTRSHAAIVKHKATSFYVYINILLPILAYLQMTPSKMMLPTFSEFEVRIFLGLSRCLNSGCGDEASDLKIQFITHCGVTDSQNQFQCEGLLIKLIS